MGCDIHIYSESLNEQGEWIADSKGSYERVKEDGHEYPEMDELHQWRNYALFGVLAEVRSSWPYSFEAKGFPEDSSEEVSKIFTWWDTDAHTPSYLTKAELQQKVAELLISPLEGAANNRGYLNEIVSQLNGEPTKQRIVFWFDN